jgi:hypothetical protein
MRARIRSRPSAAFVGRNSHCGGLTDYCGFCLWVRSRGERGLFGECEGEEQIFPGWEDQKDGDGGELAEEVVAGPLFFAGCAPEVIGDIADGMECEGNEVQRDEDGGEVCFAVSEVVLEVLAVVFQDIEGLVLDFPS